MLDAAAKHVAVLVVTAALTVGGFAIAKVRSIYFAPNMPTLQDFSGRWWITISATPGHMTIKQLKDRRLEGTFSLENGLSGRIRGRHDGYSFYNLVLTDDRDMKVFVESATAQLVGDCLVVAAVPADLTERERNSIVRFSARGCDE